ncbi:MAG: NAD(P)-dependent oxidoreductase [Nitrospira sp.]|jgi:nucleoside-diphosphate-sugar epimerase|nr:NAD(P)-dependent oxidoreductase [Nitrospira sp.]MDI3464030.1 UDP-glucose 4-epimerase [Nitrospira sp.]
MKVFVAGSTGAIGRVLVPQLVENGHEVIALVRNDRKAESLLAVGAKVAVADALNKEELTSAIRKAEPEVIIHQLTALAHAGNLKKLDDEFVLTNRFRTEVTDTLLAAARLVGARRFIAQSFCGWPFAREGGPVKAEEAPLDPNPPMRFAKILAAIRYLEDTVQKTVDLQALALRYGPFYGPGTGIAKDGPVIKLVRKRMLPIVGDGAGIWSFIHIHDAARATVAAISSGNPGIYNIVDDEPASVTTWLPALADAVGSKPPYRVPVWLGKLAIGEGGVSMMTQIRGGSNAKAKREFGWEPTYQTWRRGFVEGLG